VFLVSITRKRLDHASFPLTIRERETQGFIVSAAVDGRLATMPDHPDPGCMVLIESPFAGTDESEKVRFLELTFREREGTITIHKPTVSGRPLYYHISENGEFFCATHISLLRSAGVPVEENEAALPEFFIYRDVTPPSTLFRHISHLPTGSRLTVRIGGSGCTVASEDHYDPFRRAGRSEPAPIERIVDRTIGLLEDSFRPLDDSADSLGVFLSGGLDSSILYKLCRDRYGIDVTYSSAYPFQEAKTDIEKEYALTAAAAMGTRHVFYQGTNDEYLTALLEAVHTAEEPVNHLQSVMFHLMFKKILPEDKTIVVFGDGADSVWGSGTHSFVHRYRSRPRLYNVLAGKPVLNMLKAATDAVGRKKDFVRSLSHVARLADDYTIDDPRHIVWTVDNYGSEDWVCDFFGIDRRRIIDNRLAAVSRYDTSNVFDLLTTVQMISTARSLWSKLGEHSGKAIYYPFLHDSLLDFALSLDWETKLESPKNILRRVAHRLGIPDFIIERKKSGFGVHPDHWGKSGGLFEPLVPVAERYFDIDAIRGLQGTDMKKAMTYWNIVNYAVWKRLVIEREPLDSLVAEMKGNAAAATGAT